MLFPSAEIWYILCALRILHITVENLQLFALDSNKLQKKKESHSGVA